MNIMNSPITVVEKEEISQFNFLEEDVLDNDLERLERFSLIKRAMRLGNSFKGKVKILFEDIEGLKRVETTIWGVTEKNVLLKKMTTIPISAIHGIKFY